MLTGLQWLEPGLEAAATALPVESMQHARWAPAPVPFFPTPDPDLSFCLRLQPPHSLGPWWLREAGV